MSVPRSPHTITTRRSRDTFRRGAAEPDLILLRRAVLN